MKQSWFGMLINYLKCTSILGGSAVTNDAEDDGDEARSGLKRKPGGFKCMPYIIGNETFEKLATTGLTANFTVYLVKHFHMEQVTAANVGNIFGGTTSFAPVIGAFISDAYLGRFRTIAYGSMATVVGMVMLTMTASIPHLLPPSCSPEDLQASQCVGATKVQIGVLILSLVMLAVGAGGVRPCSLPFGVDQFNKFTEDGRKALNSFFNWYYCTSNAGVMVAFTVVVYIQNSVSWPIGFGIPTGLMLLAIVLFFLGTRHYVYVPPEGSVFSGIAEVLVAAYKKRSLPLPAPDDVVEQEAMLYNPNIRSARITKLPLTLQFRCLNKAAIKCEGELKDDGKPSNRWRLSAVQQIEEVKCLIRIIPIWAAGIICFLALIQQWTFAVLQSLVMDRHIGPHFEIPPGSLGLICLLALTLFIPVYDQLFVPVMRRITGIESGITLLQRQGVGMVISVGSMVVAGLVEQWRRSSAIAAGVAPGAEAPMSALWLAPQLTIMGIAEAFNAVGQIEFYNRQFPEHMQTMAQSLFSCTIAAASYMSSIMVSVIRNNTSWLNNDINKGRVDYFYYLIGAMGVVNMLYFLICAHFYHYKVVPEMEMEMEMEMEDQKGEKSDTTVTL